MSTSTSGGGRHRRRIRIGLPVGAAGLAAAVAAALLTTSADAATALPRPTVQPAVSSPSTAELQQRLETAIAGDDTAGETALSRSALSASTAGTEPSPTIDAKIIGGTTTTIASAPWMAQLWYGDDKGTADTSDDVGFFCGGAVVAPTKILTAAHCVAGYNWYAHGSVITGTAQLPSVDADGYITDLHGGSISGVWRQWSHPTYSPVTIDNDIAVLTLPNAVKATPIRMTTAADTASYAAGTSAKVYGWGRTSSTHDNISETLKAATLPVQSDTTCAAAYGSDFVKGHMVCAGQPATGSDAGTTTACNGDSGGPLVVNNRIVGIVSWGVEDCVAKGAYSVFARAGAYVGAVYPRIDDTNISGDHKADLWVRNAATRTGYSKNSNGSSFAARETWGNWDGVNVVLQSDLDRDGYQDLVYRRSSDGDVFWAHYVRTSDSWSTQRLADNWKTRTRILTPGDVTGDYLPDLLSVDSAGVLWIYPGKGNGTFATRVKAGSGWNQYNSVRGHGDLTGDGRADLIARSSSGSYVYLYKGTGKAGTGAFASRIKVRTWSGYNAFDAVGDISGDGKADFLARTPGGTLYLYKGTGKATSEIFATRISVGTDFKQYDIFG
ncbi:trypsin-like serine protease [Streptomyces sp. NPDC001595]|uniref:trypsin-like serine protease n=1 Tax=Streptomyces sp. NPDC001532 TaxID=3154520 RepID=UPI00331F238D